MSDAAITRELLARHHRGLAHYLRSLLPDSMAAEAALRETLIRLDRARWVGTEAEYGQWAEGIARRVAVERRKAADTPVFSDDLFRQLAETIMASPEHAEARARALGELLPSLPPPERDLLRESYELKMSADQIANAEGRPVSVVIRDLAGLHEMLVVALRQAVRDDEPDPPGGAADLGRMTGQLLDGTLTADSRLVLETLLLADAPAQAHYRRHIALATDLTWAYCGRPAVPDPPVPASAAPLSRREWAVTITFVTACLVVLLAVVLLFSGVWK